MRAFVTNLVLCGEMYEVTEGEDVWYELKEDGSVAIEVIQLRPCGAAPSDSKTAGWVVECCQNDVRPDLHTGSLDGLVYATKAAAENSLEGWMDLNKGDDLEVGVTGTVDTSTDGCTFLAVSSLDMA